jgi:hypothetical protein
MLRQPIALAVSKACGIGKDFALRQKESLADLIEVAKESEARAAQQAPAAAGVDVPATPAA